MFLGRVRIKEFGLRQGRIKKDTPWVRKSVEKQIICTLGGFVGKKLMFFFMGLYWCWARMRQYRGLGEENMNC